MLINPFNSIELTTAVNKVSDIEPYIINKLFNPGRPVTHGSRRIVFEVKSGNKKLAQFVNKGENARIVTVKDVHSWNLLCLKHLKKTFTMLMIWQIMK